jgi:hypothetical protein
MYRVVSSVSDPTVLSDGDLDRLVDDLTGQEASLSKKRARLHDRMDFLRGGGSAHTPSAAEQLRVLESEERAVSDERREIHLELATLVEERKRRRNRRG